MEQLIETPARLAVTASATREHQKMAGTARATGEAPGPRLALRNVLAIPGILLVLVLSRTFNLCGATLFAYGTFLASNPTLQLLAHTVRRERRARPLPGQNGSGFVASIDASTGDEQSDEHEFNEMAVHRRCLDPVLTLRAPPNEWS